MESLVLGFPGSPVLGFPVASYAGSPVWGFLGSLVWGFPVASYTASPVLGMQKQPFRVASHDFVAFFPLMWQEKQHKLPLFPFLVAFWQPYLL
jgi:hypothetical protein